MALFGSKEATHGLQPAAPDEARGIPVQSEELVMATEPFSQVAEQFRRLRNSLQALNPDGASRSILMTSAVRGEGKTVATLNLAMALAELPHIRVMVVDGDIRYPAVESYLGLPRRQGMTEVLRGQLVLEEAIRSTSFDGLDILGAGAQPPNPAEILNLDRIRSVLHAMKRRYDYVLIDAPAVHTMVHPSVMGAVADGILLVVRMGSTSKSLVEEAYRILENLGGNVLGTVLTGASERNAAEH